MSDAPDVRLFIHSAALFRGTTKGYGLVFTDSAVIGCKEFTEEHIVDAAPLDAQALRRVERLLGRRQFELPYAELTAVEVKAPGKFRPGGFIFRTTSAEEQVKLGGTFLSKFTGTAEVGEAVCEIIESFAPGRLQR